MIGLTERMSELMEYLRYAINEEGYAPSYDDMGAALGLKSKSGIHRMIISLEERGHIRRIPNRMRSIEIVERLKPEVTLLSDGVMSRIKALAYERCATPDEIVLMALEAKYPAGG